MFLCQNVWILQRVFNLWEISVCFKLAHQIYVDYLEKLSCPNGFARNTELTIHIVYLEQPEDLQKQG